MDDRALEIAERLDNVAEELADLALDHLRRAAETGKGSRPPEERQLTRARRSVERAAAILRDLA